MTTGKTIALTRWNFVGKVMSLLLNMLSRLVVTFLPRSKLINQIPRLGRNDFEVSKFKANLLEGIYICMLLTGSN